MASTINIAPLSNVMGASVRGIDLRKPADLSTQKLLFDLFVKHVVLCFPDQQLAAADQLRFANFFGRGDGGDRVKRRDENKSRKTRKSLKGMED